MFRALQRERGESRSRFVRQERTADTFLVRARCSLVERRENARCRAMNSFSFINTAGIRCSRGDGGMRAEISKASGYGAFKLAGRFARITRKIDIVGVFLEAHKGKQ